VSGALGQVRRFEWGFVVRQLEEFSSQLGVPAGAVDTRELEQVARDWGIVLPQDVLEVLSAFGDSIISDQIVLYGPRTLATVGAYFGARLMPGLDDRPGRPRGASPSRRPASVGHHARRRPVLPPQPRRVPVDGQHLRRPEPMLDTHRRRAL
jgi:hypothetical protein